MFQKIKVLLQRLTTPHDSVTTTEERRAVHLTMIMQLIFGCFLWTSTVIPSTGDVIALPFWIVIAVIWLSYAITRTKYYRWGLSLFIWSFIWLEFIFGWMAPEKAASDVNGIFMWLIVPLSLTTLLRFRRRETVFILVGILALFAFFITSQGMPITEFSNILSLLLFWFVLYSVTIHDFSTTEKIQRLKIQEANEQLEARVQDRTLALQESLTEKNVLLKEIHHRVKNNMQVVSSMLYLQGRMADDVRIAAALDEGRNRVQSMALIHEKLYQSENLARIDFGDYVRELVDFLAKAQREATREIKIDFNLKPVFLTVDAAVPAGLIVNELVTNAFKHAFPERRSGSISIDMACEDDAITMQIHDDGVGLPVDFDKANRGSLGMELVNNLTRQLHGELTITNTKGTTFFVSFPKG